MSEPKFMKCRNQVCQALFLGSVCPICKEAVIARERRITSPRESPGFKKQETGASLSQVGSFTLTGLSVSDLSNTGLAINGLTEAEINQSASVIGLTIRPEGKEVSLMPCVQPCRSHMMCPIDCPCCHRYPFS